jgi:hypothetical protein
MIIIKAAKVAHPTAQPLVSRSVIDPPGSIRADSHRPPSKRIHPI